MNNNQQIGSAKLLQTGDRIPAKDYNALIRNVLHTSTHSGPPGIEFPLYGTSTTALDAHSLVQLKSTATTPGRDEIPEINVQVPTAGESLVYLTNGEIETPANTLSWFSLIPFGKPVLLRADTTNAPTQGQACGPWPGQYTLDSRGIGWVALTPPFTKSGNSVVWAARVVRVYDDTVLFQAPIGGVPGKASMTPPFGFGSAVCQLIDPDTESFYTPGRTLTLYNIVDEDIAPLAVGKAELCGSKYIIDVASCGTP